MAFGMKTTTGDFLPIVKYDARAGKFFKVDKRVDGGSDAIEVPLNTRFGLDIGTLEAGYVMFGPQGPVRHMVPYIDGVAMPPQPQDKDAEGKLMFRPGFYVKVVGQAVDGAREWCSNAAVLLNAMDELYQQVIHAPEAAAGKIPLIRIASTVAVKSGTGARSSTNYAPVLAVDTWVDRPDICGPRTVPAPGGNGTAPAMTAQAGARAAAAQVQPAQPASSPPAAPAPQPQASAAQPSSMPF